jgi:hypothetical protein
MVPAASIDKPPTRAPRRPRPLRVAGLSLLANILLSLTVLPLALSPFQGYTLVDLGGVLLWQGSAAIGWPLALAGVLLSLPFGARSGGAGSLLFLLLYPAAFFLLLRMAILRRARPWEVVLLNLLVTASFAAVWYRVLNGYDFMVG